MHIARPLIFYSVLAGVLQIVCGLAALAWAWPLFVDPPFLGNGLTREYSAIRQLLAESSGATELLDGLRFKLQWLFQRQSEGVLIGLGLGFFCYVAQCLCFLVLGHGACCVKSTDSAPNNSFKPNPLRGSA